MVRCVLYRLAACSPWRILVLRVGRCALHWFRGLSVLKVDVAGIKRIASKPSTSIEVRSDMPLGQVIDLVSKVHVESGLPDPMMALDDAANVFLVGGPDLTPAGVVFDIDPESYHDFETTLRAWAATLDRAGLRGAIGPFRYDHPPFHFVKASTPTPNLVAAMVLRRDDDLELGGTAWQVPDDVRRQFLSHAQDWGREGGDTVHVSHGLKASRLESTAQIADFVAGALSIAPPVSVHWSHSDGFRTMGWDHAGHAWLQVADRRPWFERLAELETFIEAHADHLTYACVSLCSTDHLTWTRTLGANIFAAQSSHLNSSTYLSDMTAADEVRWVPGAYGSQLLGHGHLSAAHDLSQWTHVPVGDMTWVRAATPADWFADVPDREVVTAARVDFGEVIQTEEQYLAAWQARRDGNGKA